MLGKPPGSLLGKSPPRSLLESSNSGKSLFGLAFLDSLASRPVDVAWADKAGRPDLCKLL